eukprot:CAMPEP_0172160592 /NCGR_PEP_ID=MMETSP1050-20130122/5642_1 /TAXON_ID=233186 /ORGANISM="Cryptomonas curvata, Strain CCAP979/52" /LENGTH=75 /DNA_ID=CAMNT_0012830369 /DNA_START=98 /DNA_END=325 /DNA_ORIENTATION=+
MGAHLGGLDPGGALALELLLERQEVGVRSQRAVPPVDDFLARYLLVRGVLDMDPVLFPPGIQHLVAFELGVCRKQ